MGAIHIFHTLKRSYSRYRKTSIFLMILLGVCILLKLLDVLFQLALPSNNELFARVVVDKNNRPLRAFPDAKGVWRYNVQLSDVSPLYIDALLTYEDRRFWYHPGIDPLAIVRAAIANIYNGRVVSGGSTISMQVARLLHPHSRSLSGKLYQALRTLQLEWHLDKTDILTLYCNIAPFGGTIEGVQAASFTYLNKPASDLTHAEAALLAVLPQSPTRYRPDLRPAVAEAARNKVLQRMVTLKQWSQADVDAAKLETVYAVHTRIDQHAALLARRLVQDQSLAHQQVIHTTIDADLQATLEDYLLQYIERQTAQSSAAVLVVDNQSAEVIAYLGTADFGNTTRFGHVDMVQAIRSPGSTLKPFLYAMALDDGLIHSASLLTDAPMRWNDFQPSNFDGGFNGPVSASSALQRSLNLPAVQLLDKLGPNTFAARLNHAGLEMQIPGNKPNLAMILGGGGLSLEHLTQGYMAFANGGLTQALKFTKPLAASSQKADQEYPELTAANQRFFFSPEAAWITQNILTGIPRPGALLRGSALLTVDEKFAWKTGTSYGFRDTWAIGVDKNYTIGVWLGRPDGTPIPDTSGRLTAGPLLHTIADLLPNSREAIPMPFASSQLPPNQKPSSKPTNLSQELICWPLGTLKSEQDAEHCHQTKTAWIMNNTVPPTFADAQTTTRNPFEFSIDINTNTRMSNLCDIPLDAYGKPRDKNIVIEKRQVALWPIKLEPWLPKAQRRRQQIPKLHPSCTPTDQLDSNMKIDNIAPDTILRRAANSTEKPRIALTASGGEGQYHWYVDGKYIHSNNPFAAKAYEFSEIGEVEIVVTDDGGNVDKVVVRVE